MSIFQISLYFGVTKKSNYQNGLYISKYQNHLYVSQYQNNLQISNYQNNLFLSGELPSILLEAPHVRSQTSHVRRANIQQDCQTAWLCISLQLYPRYNIFVVVRYNTEGMRANHQLTTSLLSARSKAQQINQQTNRKTSQECETALTSQY